ncbi:hypothetical protein EDF58_104203 [Novosphingobium sp. PhB57]|jgi:peptidoglycan hydrolase-like protein with peptidoglycan-binding domain|uniref:hypothetical protein n=1 Tax=unclassified Novosphingobium TaxID=2644732 RepID=UPI001048A370|nr:MULTISPECIES: hypothetical protein [unclassified Novosphingobium]TCU57966.1 hypothetical protein EDF58_104203 [Novosphingobium sp. PhB57]TDW64440.1 hypothetical protein EDF57_104239 [Novosphingobium sp. PhB55]
MTNDTISRGTLRELLDALEASIPGYWIDGPYPPTSRGGVSNWQAMAYPKGASEMAGMLAAKRRIDELKARNPIVVW